MLVRDYYEENKPSANELLIFDLHSKHILASFYQKNYNITPSESLLHVAGHIRMGHIRMRAKSDEPLLVQACVFDLIYHLLRSRTSQSLTDQFHALMNDKAPGIESTKIYKSCLTIITIWDLYRNSTFNQLDDTIYQLNVIVLTANIGSKLKKDVSELMNHLSDHLRHSTLPKFIEDDHILVYFTKLLKKCQFTFSELGDEYNELFLESDGGSEDDEEDDEEVDEEVSSNQGQPAGHNVSKDDQAVRKSPRIRKKDNRCKQEKSKRTREKSDTSNITSYTDDMDLTNISDKPPRKSPRHAPQSILNATNPPQFSTPLHPPRPSKRRTKNTLPQAKRTLFNPNTSMIFDQTPNSSLALSSPGSVASDVSILSSSVLLHGRGKNKWSQEEIENLIVGVKRYGTAWRTILENCQFNSCRTNVNLKDKWRQICKVKGPDSS